MNRSIPVRWVPGTAPGIEPEIGLEIAPEIVIEITPESALETVSEIVIEALVEPVFEIVLEKAQNIVILLLCERINLKLQSSHQSQLCRYT